MTTVTVQQILDLARSQIGTLETPPGSNRIKYNDWYVREGYGEAKWYLNAQWCAIFVSWLYAQLGAAGKDVAADQKLAPIHAWTPSGLEWFEARGLVTRGRSPRPGDVFYVQYPSQTARVGHVGIVEAVLSPTQIQTIEGNTNTTGSSEGIGVFRLRRTISDRLYFCHPRYANNPPGGAPEMKLNDVIGKDAKGKPLTVGQALMRGDYAYHQILSTGAYGRKLAALTDADRDLSTRLSEVEKHLPA